MGDFWAVGTKTVELLQRLAGLGKHERVLDVGCGLGRVAWPLSQEIEGESTYDGFDTLEPYVEACRTRLGLDPKRFRFHRFDLYSSLYNPTGTVRSEDFRFPWDDDTFTLTIATSLFTHLQPDAAGHYLREIRRTLAPGGRLYATFFVLDEQSRAAIASHPTYPPFRDPFPEGLYEDAANPEAGVAFDIDWLHRLFLDTGYRITQYIPGAWRRILADEYQDVVVAYKD